MRPSSSFEDERNCWSHSGSHGGKRKLWVSRSDRLTLMNMFISNYIHVYTF